MDSEDDDAVVLREAAGSRLRERTHRAESLCEGAAQSPACAGDQRHLAIQGFIGGHRSDGSAR